MTKPSLSAIVAGLVCLSAAQSAPSPEKQVLATDKQFMDALFNGDHKELDRIIHKTAVIVTSTGSIGDRDHMIHSVRTGATRVRRMAADRVHVYMHGDTAVVTERLHSQGTARNQPINHWLQIIRVYLHEDGRWQLISYQSTRIKAG